VAGAQIRVAVVGCGHWGRNVVRAFSELGSLAAVVDNDATRSDDLAAQYAVVGSSFDAVLDDPNIDAVAIAAPAVAHHPLAADALRAGKHVFVEKPLALAVADAEDLCALAARAGRVLMVGHLLQYHPAFLRLRDLVDAGVLGRARYLYSNRLNLGRFRREENILWSFAPHDISMILSLVGEEPKEVSAVGGWFLRDSVADVTTTHLSFPGGERAHVFVSWLHPYKEQRLVVVGDEAMAVFDDGQPWEAKLSLYRHRVDWTDGNPEAVAAAGEPVPIVAAEPLVEECRHFVESIVNGTRPRTDGEEGVRVLRVLHAAQESLSAVTYRPADVLIHDSAVVEQPSEIGAGTKIWHFTHVRAGSRIGANCSVGQNVMIGPDVTIGDGCKIQNNVSIYEGVDLGDDVFCGPSCVFTNVRNPRADVDRRGEFERTRVGRGATIGANATIVCGHDIGDYAFIGAGAVVTDDVPAHALVVGVPGRRIGWVSHAGERLGPDLVCPRTGRRYREVSGQLEELTTPI
jgi:predicted dehydrogenase/acetyltransferase-like isoleucine patch superfamily enzyme